MSAYYDFVRFLKKSIKDRKIDAALIKKYAERFQGSPLFKKFLNYLVTEEGIKMVNIEYDYETEKAVLKEEHIQEGIEKGIEKVVCSMFKKGFPIDQIADILECSDGEVKAILSGWKNS